MELCNPKSIKLQIGTKPLTNLLVFQNSKHKNNISQTDYGSNPIFLNGSNPINLFGSFLKEASKLDSYEYFLFLDNPVNLSKHFYHNLSTWKPLLRYQIDFSILRPNLGPLFTQRSNEYTITSFVDDYIGGPFLFSSRYIKTLYNKFDPTIKLQDFINNHLQTYNMVCFWPKNRFLFDDKKEEFDEFEIPLVIPDGLPDCSYSLDYFQLYNMTFKKSVVYLGSSAAELLVLAQSCCELKCFIPNYKIHFITMKIWLERFGLLDRVKFMQPDDFKPSSEDTTMVYSSYDDINDFVKINYIPYFPSSIFIGESQSASVAEQMGIKLTEHSMNIRVKA
jgi:hypothetical protein